MPIVQQGAQNSASIIVPDVYIQIVAPQNLVLNGIPTNVIGVVGTGSWGPVNTPVILSGSGDCTKYFGPLQNRKYDLGTSVATMVQQGASNFRGVRVTDTTDTAATVIIQPSPTPCLTVNALYTGSLGNSLTVTLATGSKASTFKITLTLPGNTPEVYDNIGGTGNAFWVNAAAAINGGNSPLRGPSMLVTATAGAGTASPTVPATVTLSGGTDGATSIVPATHLVGSDSIPRTGMYSLRMQGVSIGVLADCDVSATWTTQAQFALSEGIYFICTGPAGDTISNAVATKATAGLDSYGVKLMFGDWIFWNDPVNGVTRLVSPQGFVAGRLANLSPQNSSLNKQMYSIVGTQKSGLSVATTTAYSDAELQTLFQAGIDVICNPQPGGSYYGCRLGHNSSSYGPTNGDNYTRLTNFIAATLNAGMGAYVGLPIQATLFNRVSATLTSFLNNLLQQGLLGSLDGSMPFSVVCNLTNNPLSRTSLGYLQADVQVQYMAINEKFLINLEGGQTVIITKQTLPSGQVGS